MFKFKDNVFQSFNNIYDKIKENMNLNNIFSNLNFKNVNTIPQKLPDNTAIFFYKNQKIDVNDGVIEYFKNHQTNEFFYYWYGIQYTDCLAGETNETFTKFWYDKFMELHNTGFLFFVEMCVLIIRN